MDSHEYPWSWKVSAGHAMVGAAIIAFAASDQSSGSAAVFAILSAYYAVRALVLPYAVADAQGVTFTHWSGRRSAAAVPWGAITGFGQWEDGGSWYLWRSDGPPVRLLLDQMPRRGRTALVTEIERRSGHTASPPLAAGSHDPRMYRRRRALKAAGASALGAVLALEGLAMLLSAGTPVSVLGLAAPIFFWCAAAGSFVEALRRPRTPYAVLDDQGIQVMMLLGTTTWLTWDRVSNLKVTGKSGQLLGLYGGTPVYVDLRRVERGEQERLHQDIVRRVGVASPA